MEALALAERACEEKLRSLTQAKVRTCPSFVLWSDQGWSSTQHLSGLADTKKHTNHGKDSLGHSVLCIQLSTSRAPVPSSFLSFHFSLRRREEVCALDCLSSVRGV